MVAIEVILAASEKFFCGKLEEISSLSLWN